MDNAICGGSGSTLTGAALAAVKAAIFMGDPHNVNGLPYNVGTCKNGGVSSLPTPCGTLHPSFPKYCLNKQHSLQPVPPASSARPPTAASSSRTATPRTHTAATATTQTRTSSTSTSTVRRRWLSSRARSLLRLCCKITKRASGVVQFCNEVVGWVCTYYGNKRETCTYFHERSHIVNSSIESPMSTFPSRICINFIHPTYH